jgi:subtilisin family serine protease
MKKVILWVLSAAVFALVFFGTTGAQNSKKSFPYPLDGYRPNIDFMDNQVLLLVPEDAENIEIFLQYLRLGLKQIGAYFDVRKLESIRNIRPDLTFRSNVCGGILVTIRSGKRINRIEWENNIIPTISTAAARSGTSPDTFIVAPNDGMRMPQTDDIRGNDPEASIGFLDIKNAINLPSKLISDSSVLVAVIDSGFAEINGNLSRFNQAFGINLISRPERDAWLKDDYQFPLGNGGTLYGHGSVVARILSELAPQAQIIPIKACTGGLCTGENIATGICWAVAKGAKVINISAAGFFPSPLVRQVVLEATQSGVLVVASAGNSRNLNWIGTTDISYFDREAYPAAWAGGTILNGMISVGAINGCPVPTIAGYSKIGSTVSVATYGKINLPYSLQLRIPADPVRPLVYRDQPTSTRAGTSFSTPIISAIAAIKIQQSNGRISPIEIKTQIVGGVKTAKDNQALVNTPGRGSYLRASGKCSNVDLTPVESGYTKVDTGIRALQVSELAALVRP